jgi:hypothetical protein
MLDWKTFLVASLLVSIDRVGCDIGSSTPDLRDSEKYASYEKEIKDLIYK